MPIVLEIRDLAVIRGCQLVFQGLSHRLASGAALTLVGPNGAGKTTLLRAIAGLVPAAAGGIFWQGEDMRADLPAYQRRLAYLGHLDGVKPGLTVAENVASGWIPASPRAERRATLRRALEATGLGDLAEVPARLLSAGQRRRVALSRLCLKDASLWLLDEPSTGLDAASLAALGTMVAAHRAKGGIVITATHQPLPIPQAEVLSLAR